MKRDDIHSETNFVASDYEFTGFFDSSPDYPMSEGELIEKRALIKLLIENRSSVHGLGQCAHCGSHIRYHVVFHHMPTDTYVVIGSTCADGRFSWPAATFDAFRKSVADRRERTREIGKINAWASEAPQNQETVDFLNSPLADEMGSKNDGVSAIVNEFKMLIGRRKPLTENQVKLILKLRDRHLEFKRLNEERKALGVEVPEGSGVRVCGTLVSVKLVDTPYGNCYKMTVKDDSGFLVWGTLPSVFDNEVDGLRGRRIKFVANIKRSDRDKSFGFFSRPRQTTIDGIF